MNLPTTKKINEERKKEYAEFLDNIADEMEEGKLYSKEEIEKIGKKYSGKNFSKGWVSLTVNNLRKKGFNIIAVRGKGYKKV